MDACDSERRRRGLSLQDVSESSGESCRPRKGLSKKKWAALIILNLQENSNLLKFKYEQRRKR